MNPNDSEMRVVLNVWCRKVGEILKDIMMIVQPASMTQAENNNNNHKEKFADSTNNESDHTEDILCGGVCDLYFLEKFFFPSFRILDILLQWNESHNIKIRWSSK